MNRMGGALQQPDSVPQETMNQLCACIATLLRSLDKTDVIEMHETVVEMLMAMFSHTGGTVHEDAFMALSALFDTLGPDAAQLADAFAPYVVAGLQNVEDHMVRGPRLCPLADGIYCRCCATADTYCMCSPLPPAPLPLCVLFVVCCRRFFSATQVCHAATGVVSGLTRVLGQDMANYAEGFLTEMIGGLQNPLLESIVKIEIVGALGDMCLALGEHFFPFFEVVMQALAAESERAAPAVANENDFAAIDANNDMREALLTAFEGIIQGLKGDDPNVLNQGTSQRTPTPDLFPGHLTCCRDPEVAEAPRITTGPASSHHRATPPLFSQRACPS